MGLESHQPILPLFSLSWNKNLKSLGERQETLLLKLRGLTKKGKRELFKVMIVFYILILVMVMM